MTKKNVEATKANDRQIYKSDILFFGLFVVAVIFAIILADCCFFGPLLVEAFYRQDLVFIMAGIIGIVLFHGLIVVGLGPIFLDMFKNLKEN